MSDMMTFPATVEEFMEQYKIVDDEKVYTNGADLVPIFRMMQWFEHVSATDTISRQAAIMDAESWVAVDEYEKNLQKKVVEWLKEFQPAELGTNLAEVGTDTISRQAAIEGKIYVRRSNGVEIYDDYVVPVEYLEQLPPAQPETHEERTETHACDYINRKDAIDAHYEYCNKHPDAGFPVWSLKILEDLPSAQPELPEWAQKVEEYRKSAPSFVRNQLVWALYQTWKEYDGRLVHQRGKENR